MRLADFIEQNTRSILEEWVEFAAANSVPGRVMDLDALRDDALGMLKTIVADLRTPQTGAEQKAKSRGKADSPANAPDTAAEMHGSERAQTGFTIAEMVSEYRALRASVIRLWTEQSGSLTGADLEDLMRFNETIDQALAESTERFSTDIDRSREIFVGILGHDLRTPLNAVVMASQIILDAPDLHERNLGMTQQTLRSALKMNSMVSDLLDFTRGRLGSGIPITREELDLGLVVRQVIEEVKLAYPDSVIQSSETGNLTVRVDRARIAQMVLNLLTNAVQYGTPRSVIAVSVLGESADVVIRVHNLGTPIPAADLPGIFSPFKRLGSANATPGGSSNLGFGLYIVERIVTAHGGSVDVRSSTAGGTLFTIRLPRDAA
ncbi:MAG TPA: sensor histidine kinase [Gemmatimonadaceae bacterium]|nr:sensor histidine kinase [Gemmatimonadaceae bacterium]